MTISQNMRIAGFRANLATRGRRVKANTGEWVFVLVKDAPMMQDPDKPAQAQTPVYVDLFALAGSVADPRAIETFTENQGLPGEKIYTIQTYPETAGDQVTWKWFCESQRTDFGNE